MIIARPTVFLPLWVLSFTRAANHVMAARIPIAGRGKGHQQTSLLRVPLLPGHGWRRPLRLELQRL